jgi:hypothetical protein
MLGCAALAAAAGVGAGVVAAGMGLVSSVLCIAAIACLANQNTARTGAAPCSHAWCICVHT